MLKLTIPGWEDYDPVKSEFIQKRATTIMLEHSLVSISKWEAKYHKAFLHDKEITDEQMLYYIQCMTVTPNVPEEVYLHMTTENMEEIRDYISDPMTATTFSGRQNKKPSREIITSEVLYYDMIAFGVPFECKKWHLNRLITLLHVCEIKNSPKKKMSKKDAASQYRSLNAARRAKHNSKG